MNQKKYGVKLMSIWLCLAIIVSGLTVSVTVGAIPGDADDRPTEEMDGNAPPTEEMSGDADDRPTEEMAGNAPPTEEWSTSGDADDRPTEELLKLITLESGTTDEYGGGAYNQIRFSTPQSGLDSAFGVIWGTEVNPNSIVLYSIQTTTLGVVNMKESSEKGGTADYNDGDANTDGDTDGGDFIQSKMQIHTFSGLKLDDIIEFDDRNRDGMCNFQREYSEEGFKNYQNFEPVYNKQIDLKTEWKVGEGEKATNAENLQKSWDFKLVAQDQAYEKIRVVNRIDKIAENNVLNKLEFTFHLTARLVPVEGVMVPQYDIKLMKDSNNKQKVLEMERADSIECSALKAEYDVKWDHLIKGWDYNETNKNPSLLMGFHNIMGNAIPFSTASWMRERLINDINRSGRVKYEDENGTQVLGLETENGGLDMDDELPMFGKTKPKLLKSNKIEFQGNWTRISRFQWISDVEVDGNQSKMHAQIMGGTPFKFTKNFKFGKNSGQIVTGVATFGAFTYKGGKSIYHDPSVDGDMFVELTIPIDDTIGDTKNDDDKTKLVVIAIIGIIVVLALIAGSMNIRKKRLTKEHERSLREQHDRGNGNSKSSGDDPDWEEYYEPKK